MFARTFQKHTQVFQHTRYSCYYRYFKQYWRACRLDLWENLRKEFESGCLAYQYTNKAKQRQNLSCALLHSTCKSVTLNGENALTMTEDVVLDVDTGVDDALALILAVRSPQINVVAVTCVAGNGEIDTVVDATLRVLDASEAPLDLPVAKGCAKPLLEPGHAAPFIHGHDCLGDLLPKVPRNPERVASKDHAVTLLVNLLRERADAGNPLTIVALAPLTNLALALRLDEDAFRNGVKRIYWMGGAVSRGGNYKAWSEANAAYDPEAASIVLSSGVPITMYPWDCFLDLEFNAAELESFGMHDPGPDDCVHSGPELAARLMYREMRQWKKDTAVLGDAGTVAGLIAPEGFITEAHHVSVELSGKHTRGMTVVDLREFVDPPDEPKGQANVDVVKSINMDILKRVFQETVFNEPLAPPKMVSTDN